MRTYLTLTRRELGTYFVSMTGYVVIAILTFLVGFVITSLLKYSIGDAPLLVPLTELFFSNLYFWIFLMIITPIMTIRLFALEKSSGTFETLMTTQVTDFQVVAAKFTGSLIFYLVAWLPSLVGLLVISHFANQSGALDAGTLFGMYFGIFMIGCLYISFGCFASAITQSQIVAATVSLAFGFSMILLVFLANQFPGSEILAFFNFGNQFHDFLRGVVDTRALVFHFSLSFFFLFLTLRIVESRHWK